MHDHDQTTAKGGCLIYNHNPSRGQLNIPILHCLLAPIGPVSGGGGSWGEGEEARTRILDEGAGPGPESWIMGPVPWPGPNPRLINHPE